MSSLLLVLSFIVLFQLAFVSYFLFSSRKGRRLSNYLLAFFFLSLGAGLMDFVLLKLEVFDRYQDFAFLLNSLVLLHPPLLYLYVQSLTRKGFRLKVSHLLHTWAVILGLGLLVPFYYLKSDEVQQFVLEGVQEGERSVFIVISIVGLIYEIAYLGAVKYELRNYRKRLRQHFSNTDKINLTWLNYMVNIFIITFSLNIISSTIRHSSMNHLDEIAVIFGLFGFFYFINSILLKGLHQNDIFLGSSQEDASVPVNLEMKKELINKLTDHLRKEKSYLRADLTVDQLAVELGIPPRSLSYMINNEMGHSFFDLINKYRVEEAQEEIRKAHDTTILEIMYRVGFNSKSSFNTAFKKFTGVTPTTFKAQFK